MNDSANCTLYYKIIALNNAAFTPRVIIPGVPTAGDNFIIICRLDGLVERLTNPPSRVILNYGSTPGGEAADQIEDGLAYILPRQFNPGTTSDAGIYTCDAVVQFSGGGGAFSPFADGTLRIQSMIVVCLLVLVENGGGNSADHLHAYRNQLLLLVIIILAKFIVLIQACTKSFKLLLSCKKHCKLQQSWLTFMHTLLA